MNKIEQLENMIVEMKHKLAIAELDYIIETGTVAKKKLQAKLISEGFIDNHNGPEEANIDKLRRMLDAASKALEFANKLKSPEQKKANQSRIMSHINKLANALMSATKGMSDQRDIDANLPFAARGAKSVSARLDKDYRSTR